ncbi:arylsulfatase B-like [Ptychodera flava]|uniref:arylsulfatase B-like n=1 Tax=Ptychodera flava TaxID=63121 RepID=UPI003969CA91
MMDVKILVVLSFLNFPAVYCKDRQPHIVFILADDLGYYDIGYHGSRIQTPVLDKLANQGIKLENYYVQPICTPTRSQLMSGRYQIHTGMQHKVIFPSQPLCLPTDEVTIADKLKEAGYATHMVGKWHLGHYREDCLPTKRGFDTFFGFYNCAVDYYTYEKDCYHHFANGSSVRLSGRDLWRNDEEFVALKYTGQHRTKVFANEAQKVIRKHDSDKPLFLYLSFGAVHVPLEAPNKYEEMYEDVEDYDRRLVLTLATMMDEAVGNVTSTLRETGLWDNTIVIFSSDNGGATSHGGSNWPLRGGKKAYYEGGIKVAGFISSPLLPPNLHGSTNRELIHVSDWFPTLVHLARGNLDGTKPLDGYNQWDTIRHQNPSPRKEILINIDPMIECEQCKKDSHWQSTKFDVHLNAGLIVGSWKLLTGHQEHAYWSSPSEVPDLRSIIGSPSLGKMVSLYNIKSDPTEQTDLAERMPGVVHRMLEKLADYNSGAVPPYYPENEIEADPSRHGGAWGPWAQ